jgi:hypothetical protein
MENTKPAITEKHLAVAYTYAQYRTMLDELLALNLATGHRQSPELVHLSKVNIHRMHRWDKTTVLHPSLVEKLKDVEKRWIWLILTEGWCPDSAQNIPVIAKMAQQNENISLKLLLRDAHPEIMDRYLTNGSRSIPKLICLKADTLEEIGTWGPRPAILQQRVIEHKKNPVMADSLFKESLQAWYAKDKAQHLQQEFEELIVKWSQKQYV